MVHTVSPSSYYSSFPLQRTACCGFILPIYSMQCIHLIALRARDKFSIAPWLWTLLNYFSGSVDVCSSICSLQVAVFYRSMGDVCDSPCFMHACRGSPLKWVLPLVLAPQ
eukprot:961698_1